MRSSLLVAACGALILSLPAASSAATAKTGARDWSEEKALETSARLIDQCLASLSASAPEAGLGCVDTAFDACTRENGGTMSQRDLNFCREFSKRAWRARYDKLLVRFEALFRAWAQAPADDWKRAVAARFPQQEQEWQRWMASDCETREIGSVGGSIHNFAVASCENRHLAYRTIDLAPLLEWWETR